MGRRRKDETPMSFFSFQDIIMCTTGVLVIITLLLALDLVNRKLNAARPPAPSTQPLDSAERATALRKTIDELQKELAQATTTSALPFNVSQQEIDELRREIARLTDLYNKWDKVLRDLAGRLAQLLALLDDVNRSKDGARTTLENLLRDIEVAKLVNKLPFAPRGPSGKSTQYVEFSKDSVSVRMLTPQGPQMVANFSGGDCAEQFLKWAAMRNPESEWFAVLVRPDGVEGFRNIKDNLESLKFDTALTVYPRGKEFFSQRP